MIRIRCRQCDRKWGLADSEAGSVWRCPACKQEAVLPGQKIDSSARPSKATRKTVPGRDVVPPPAAAEPLPTLPAVPAAQPVAPVPPPVPPLAAMADSNIAMIDSSASIETDYSRPAGNHAAMIDSAPVIEFVSEIKPPARNPDEKPYEISDSDVVKAEVMGFAEPLPPTTVIDAIRELATLEAESVHPSEPKRKKKKKIDWQGDLGWQRDVLFVLCPLGFLWLVLTASSFIKPHVAWGMLALGLLVYGAGKIAILLNAAEEGMLQGLFCLVPFYTPWYFLVHWREVLRPFLMASAGVILVLTGAAFTSHYGLINPVDSALKVDTSDVDVYRMLNLPDPRIGKSHVIKETGAPTFGKNRDETLANLANGPGAAEAKHWLESSDKHILTHGTRAEAVRRVIEVYNLGARKVTVVEIAVVPDQFRPGDRVHTSHEEAHHVVLELPDDHASRRKIFDFVAKALGQDFPAEDSGQKYLEMELGSATTD
jgi:hypothetical protein